MWHSTARQSLQCLRRAGRALLLPLLLAACERGGPAADQSPAAAAAAAQPASPSGGEGEPRPGAPDDDISAPQAAVAWGGSIRDSAGVQLVVNPAKGLWLDGVPWRLRETLRIGEPFGGPAVRFGRIEGLAMDTAGRVYVADAMERNVRVFAPDGALLADFGRGGAGPGELSGSLGGVFAVPGDTVLVPDLINSRINWFADGGTTSGSYPPFDRGGGVVAAGWRLHPAGMFWSELTVPGRGTSAAIAMDALVVARDLRGGGADTLLSYRWVSGEASADVFVIRPFAPRTVWGIGPAGGLLYAQTTEYRIHVRDGSNRLVRIISRPADRESVGRRDIDRLTTKATKGADVLGGLPMPIRVDVSDGLPMVTGLLPGPGETIWVQRGVTAAELTGQLRDTEAQMLRLHEFNSPRWDVFDADGRYLGELRMPPRFQLYAIHGMRLLGIWRDDMDVEYVKVLSLETADG